MQATRRERAQKSRSGAWLRKLGRGCLRLLLILLLLAAVAYCVEYYKGSRYTPTGDALFDCYARAVIRRQAPRLWFTDSWRCEYFNAHLLPDSQLAQWEGEFGSDPRYWQLRMWNAQGSDTDTDVLRAGYGRGAQDAMLVLLLARRRSWTGAAAIAPLKPGLDGPEAAAVAERIAQLEQATGKEVEQLYAEAIELAPGQAWPYYERALARLAREDYADAEADFAAGNAAPLNDAFDVYPEPVLREQLLADPCGPNATLYGMLRSPFCAPYCYNWSVLCDKRHKLCGLVERQPTSMLNAEFHRFLCRAAQEPGEPGEAIVCLRASQRMAESVQKIPALTPEQQATLLYANTLPRSALQATWTELELGRATSPSMNWTGLGWPWFSCSSNSLNPRNRASYAVILTRYFPRTFYRDTAWVEHVYIESAKKFVTPAAKQLEALDYTTIALPAAWRESNLEPAEADSQL
jgi:hypothetical protein